ncbi:hypothetical protein SAMD00019534_075210 [Acytostelium subglobosum LB1]|uniref:hypothetical protein n=1 Tax=Acytostelium subglobosum LB1 TaxID=1410327 RepID=UPI000645073B|nr:hypothetical protein SAMD00019534_075210 [Acytostelium subglobosum LB1]GAM24346.1 hypothetical protein SAMD00019534_075210 [Acytostelium subglobosum LB1]|eukprot:XP_012752672.1 hypothetical protein SAMD00019534_075210 [Acytostelium subglobosum LB1]
MQVVGSYEDLAWEEISLCYHNFNMVDSEGKGYINSFQQLIQYISLVYPSGTPPTSQFLFSMNILYPGAVPIQAQQQPSNFLTLQQLMYTYSHAKSLINVAASITTGMRKFTPQQAVYIVEVFNSVKDSRGGVPSQKLALFGADKSKLPSTTLPFYEFVKYIGLNYIPFENLFKFQKSPAIEAQASPVKEVEEFEDLFANFNNVNNNNIQNLFIIPNNNNNIPNNIQANNVQANNIIQANNIQVNNIQANNIQANNIQVNNNIANTSGNIRISQQQQGNNTNKQHIFSDIEIQYSELQTQSKLGEGTFGLVYKGTWRGSTVAIKQIKVHDDVTNQALDEFRKELTILSKLRHPNIVLLMAACTQPPNLCFVTEYLCGGSLYDALHSKKIRMNMPLYKKLGIQIAQGMNYLHLSGIIHRDIKSLNLLLDENMNVKICDFGLSRFKSKSAAMTKSIGSPIWMAPELLMGSDNYTEKVDVYAYGIILWEIGTGELPYSGLDSVQLAVAVSTKGLRPTIPSTWPAPLHQLIQSCWHQDANQRPTFTQILAQLDKLTV